MPHPLISQSKRGLKVRLRRPFSTPAIEPVFIRSRPYSPTRTGSTPSPSISMSSISNTLTDNWSYAQINKDGNDGEFASVERVPSSVHVELLKVSRLPLAVCPLSRPR